MNDAIRQRLQLLRQEEAKPVYAQQPVALKMLRKEILEAALVEIAVIGTCGMRAFAKDKDWVSRLVVCELLNPGTVSALKDALFCGSEESYDSLVTIVAGRMKKAYGKYFRSLTQNKGAVYNPLLNMYWNEKLQLWERKDPDGWVSYSAFMPYAAA